MSIMRGAPHDWENEECHAPWNSERRGRIDEVIVPRAGDNRKNE